MAVTRKLMGGVAALALSIPGTAAIAASAGVVVHISGSASVERPDGSVSVLAQRSAVNAGDTLTTQRDSYVQINFTDGGMMTLRPNTTVRLEAYHFEKDKPREDNSVVGILKGGLRTVTGLIGRRGNQEAYKISTRQATIGIRGSSGDTLECSAGCPDVTPTSGKLPPGVYHATHTGAYVMQNAAGSQLVGPGQFGYVKDANTPPVLLPKDPGLGLSELPFSLGVRESPQGSPSQECVVR